MQPIEFSQQFRDAMAHLCAAVSIVTSNGKAGKVGITVSSVCSVSDSPPTLLFCINQSSDLHDIIAQNRQVCVNVLSHEQEELAKHFACMLDSTMEQRFSWDIWQESEQGLPLLKGAISTLQGEIIDSHSVGSHTIFITRLTQIDTAPNHSLVYFGRQFNQVEL
ncbi:4-hydroxyphenylacetate 3-monooxygenase, reductase component [Haemophilus paracuniculus]|uniref:4-hydroxyphenylacetate 3-monooxygenase reductase component n=1 Tax=Haemophilus paracuniculus TaxID=734 RepID=A0A1T0AUM9_9PAST|nr:4-hydroxyphenylacetate 3-monooxygenase, reductase component [Haemophilus paracuniculus]OOR99887.1 4-hydroxyphenylacetate 3-monooxygenase, reductase component [Haemophilus paracuniculus]